MLALALGLPACGSAADALDNQGPLGAGGESVGAAPIAAGAPDEEDLLPLDRAVRGALTTAGTGAPKVIYLMYADGKTASTSTPDACHAVAPKFTCQFASTLKECQRQIQAYLDKWYADFNVVFTLQKPTSGAFYTEIVSSGGGAWCGAPSTTAGLAPFYCDDIDGGVAYAFMAGTSAKETAIIIAQEQAHLVGLEHTTSQRDVMNPTVCTACDGFENVDNNVDGDHCGRNTQNSYRMLRDRVGVWAGGVKPSPFGCDPDVSAPSVSIVQPANGAKVSAAFQLSAMASDDCQVKSVSVRVDPLGLSAESTTAPFTWNLTRISGRQTITVTATDTAGKQSSASIIVDAPGASGSTTDAGASDAGTDGSAPMTAEYPAMTPATGCEVGGCAAAGTGPTAGRWSVLIMLLTSLGALRLLRDRRRVREARQRRR